MEECFLEKVTALVTRAGAAGPEVLLFEHPYAGVQLPAGTVEAGELPEMAALREVFEETGLTDTRIARYLGHRIESRPGMYMVVHETRVYARPDCTSFAWAEFRRGIEVEDLGRRAEGFAHVSYCEGNVYPDPAYVTYQITGWVPAAALGVGVRRHFFHLTFSGVTPASWVQPADCHHFRCFWAALAHLPALVTPQKDWLAYALQQMGGYA